MNEIQAHRGPDGHATWAHGRGAVGFAHRRLTIIDLATGDQPMRDEAGNWISYNGEIYNYIELRAELGDPRFRTTSDTEVALRAYEKWGADCVQHFRGMFAFSIWDEAKQTLFCARDRFGIKPFYYTEVDGILYFASEIKALIPFLPEVETDPQALKDYLCFQFCLEGKTLFKGVRELLPGHTLTVRNGNIEVSRYWEVYYSPDFGHQSAYFEHEIRELMAESVALHLRSDVPVGAYVSGGLDSSIIASLAAETQGPEFLGFTGRFAYFEQCIKGAIEGTMHSGKFVVTYESIIPNLVALRNYKPMLQEFWRDGLFENLDRRYFRLINRAPSLGDEINWSALGQYDPWESFQAIFNGANVGKESYFDSMTHFDFKTLLPALLQVEDRVSMAHGLESRVPFLDHRIVELAATIPSDVKFENGNMKHVLRTAMRGKLPERIVDRQDKMGFPVPLQEWLTTPGPVRDYVHDVFSSQAARSRELIDNRRVLQGLESEVRFGRKAWGLLSLELWQQAFHDQAHEFRSRITTPTQEVIQ